MTIYLKNLDLAKIYKDRAARRGKRNPCNSFPVKLHRMLTSVEEQEKDHIIGWCKDGISFHVHNSDLFMSEILPNYFKQTKFKSFQRQLNFYGFRRINHGPLEGSYCHQFFIRGDEEACKKIRRQTNHEFKSTMSCEDLSSSSQDHDMASLSSDVLSSSERSDHVGIPLPKNEEDSEDPELQEMMKQITPIPLTPQESIILEGAPVNCLGRNFFYVSPNSYKDEAEV